MIRSTERKLVDVITSGIWCITYDWITYPLLKIIQKMFKMLALLCSSFFCSQSNSTRMRVDLYVLPKLVNAKNIERNITHQVAAIFSMLWETVSKHFLCNNYSCLSKFVRETLRKWNRCILKYTLYIMLPY